MMGTMDKLLIQASMGPRFCKRGNLADLTPETHLRSASMGPRFCKRGNTHADIISRRAVFVLQWGHAFVSVETSGQRAILYCIAHSFNGATLL